MLKRSLLVLFLLGFVDLSYLLSQPVLPLQNKKPIANFSLNEDDTTCYLNHYLYERAYQTIEDMLLGKRPLSFKDAVFEIENALLDGQANRKAYDYKISVIANNILYDAN